MPPTLTELTAAAVVATRGSAGAWVALTAAEQTTAKSYMRFGLDYLAAQRGLRPEDIYTVSAASPGDPLPEQPPA